MPVVDTIDGIRALKDRSCQNIVRGLGLGQRLLDKCIAFARETGNASLCLWTHERHRAACALYKKNGFTCVEARPVTSLGVDLMEQTWQLDLT